MKSRLLNLEQLEDRCTPATYGNPWPDAAHLTMSFVPDGTVASTGASDLFQSLASAASSSTWQREIYRAFQTWAAVANLNLGVVADGGQALGSPGILQSDARFGDIRLAAYSMDPSVLALTSPFEATGGTWSGDLKFNSDIPFDIGGTHGYDLYTVAVHELGHALGLPESDDPKSVMFESYQGVRNGLGASDVAAIQALYGARRSDAGEGNSGNDSFANATRLSLLLSGGVTSVTQEGDLSAATDKEFYSFTAPLSLGGLTVRLQTLGLSLLAPRLTVYNASRQVVGTVASPGPNGGNLEIRINGLSALATYYVKIEGAAADAFAIGGYRLKVDSLPGVSGVVQTTSGAVDSAATLLNVDLHTNDSILTASLLPQPFATANSRFDYAFRGSISDGIDVDYYKIKAAGAAGTTSVMTVMGWGLVANGLAPRLSVFDASAKQVPADVLVNEAGNYTIQVPGAKGGVTYYVKIQAAQPGDSSGIGNYFLGVDFGPRAVALKNFVADTLTATAPQDFYSLTFDRTVLFHFNLSADTNNSPIEAAVRMTIYDKNDRVVFTMVARAGQTVTSNVVLKAGAYQVRFAAATRDPAKNLPALRYGLAGLILDDPIGPKPSDTTTAPSGGSNPPQNNPMAAGTSSSSSVSPTYSPTWSNAQPSSKPMSPSDPYSNPYTGV